MAIVQSLISYYGLYIKVETECQVVEGGTCSHNHILTEDQTEAVSDGHLTPGKAPREDHLRRAVDVPSAHPCGWNTHTIMTRYTQVENKTNFPLSSTKSKCFPSSIVESGNLCNILCSSEYPTCSYFYRVLNNSF